MFLAANFRDYATNQPRSNYLFDAHRNRPRSSEGHQCPNKSITEFQEHGSRIAGDSGSDINLKPSWLDVELLIDGRRVACDHLFGLMYGHLSGLYMLVYLPSILFPLLATGASKSVADLFVRYLSTLRHVHTWYAGDISNSSDDAAKSIALVRRMHSQIAQRLNAGKTSGQNVLYLSAWDMHLTQFAFVGLPILKPQYFGFRDNPKDLEALIHFWRYVGHLLGIPDHYNLCNKPLPELREHCQLLLDNIFKPALAKSQRDSSAMSDGIVESVRSYIPGLAVNGFKQYLYDTIALRSKDKNSVFSLPMDLTSRVSYYASWITFRYLLHIPSVCKIFNRLLCRALAKAIRRRDTIRSNLEGHQLAIQAAFVTNI